MTKTHGILKSTTFWAVVCSLSLCSSAVFATTIHVPADYPTIQAGIDAAVDGDTVLVADGTYTDVGNKDIDFGGKAITVQSENGPEHCIIDCEGTGRGFYFHTSEGENSVVFGFTIRNGHADLGGGILCENTSPQIDGCVIKDSIADSGGGGIAFTGYQASPTIKNCFIRMNRASGGGGIYIAHLDASVANPNIDNCRIIENTATNDGGGIYIHSNTGRKRPLCSNSIIRGNSAANGGGIFCCYFSSTFVNCLIAENTATVSGGGVYSTNDPSKPAFINCTICDNTAAMNGGGIISAIDGTYANCIIFSNSPNQLGTGFHGVVTYSDIEGGHEGTGNIDAGPLFADDDYHLQPGSPCVNAGDPNSFFNDFDGSRNDMGYTGGSDLFADTGRFDFGYVGVGTSKELSVAIYNTKSVDVVLGALFLGSPQLWTTARFPLTISPGSCERIQVSFNPTASGPFESTVQIDCDGLYGATFASFPVTGYGYTGGTIHVPSEAPTIQIAVDGCSNGDTVLIAPGTYFENISFADKAIVIMSSEGPWATIIDGGGSHAFDITMGTGGIVEMIGLSITDSDMAIHAGGGNGIFKIRNSYMYRNNVGISGWGHVSFDIVNCLIVQNQLGFQHTYYGNDSSIINSTFADNATGISFTPSYGTSSKLDIFNSILRDQVTGTTENPVYLNYCNYDPTKLGTNVTVQDGCQTGDPLFVDMINSNYRLQPESPCIDAGTSAGAPGDDIEGVTRPQGAGYDMGAYEFGGTPNVSPTADAGPDQIVFNKVTLDGSGSSDPDGSIVTYQWQLNHRTNPAFNRTATGIKPTVSNLKKGYYDVTLTVRDDQAAIDTDTMELAVAGNRVVVVPLY